MFIFKKNTLEKDRPLGQAMVEFALVLPILLTLVLGIIEAGRLLFIYGSAVTASRQAVRYGSAIGDNGSGKPKYLDCTGIENDAKAMGFINEINTVIINYTRSGSIIADCDTGDSTYPNPTEDLFINGDRIEVTAETNYAPMVPMGNFGTFTISTNSRRTIFASGIAIASTPENPSATPAIALAGTVDKENYSFEEDILTFTFTLTNSGDGEINSYTISTTPSLASYSCTGSTPIAEGASVSCSGTYTVTSDDLGTGKQVQIVGTASAEAADGTSLTAGPVSAISTFEGIAKITLEKGASPTVTTSKETITYTFTITNTGWVDLTTYNIVDEKINPDGSKIVIPVSCPSGVTLSHETDDSLECTASYTITQDDLDHGTVTNEAEAIAGDGAEKTATATASATVYTNPLKLSVTTNRPGDPGYDILSDTEVEFNYIFQNVGVTPLSDLRLDSVLFGTVTNCDNRTDLSATTLSTSGAPVICSMVHSLKQSDMDQGFIDDDAVGYADNGNIETALQEIRAQAALIPDLALAITSPLNETVIPTGTTKIPYTYKITNDGNLTLTSSYTIKDSEGATLCTDIFDNLAPGAFTTCTYEYPIVDPDDWNAGSIISTVTASTIYTAWDNSTIPVTSNPVTSTVYTYDGDRITLSIIASSGDTPISVGDDIFFTYIIQNTGNTTLSPLAASDYPLTSNLTNHIFSACDTVTADFGPGKIIKTCKVPYRVDIRDVTNDELVNEASAQAENQSGTAISATTILTLEVVPVQICEDDQWTSSKYYQSPDVVFYCEGDSCNTWKAQQSYPSRGNRPGYAPPNTPSFWTNQGSCVLDRTCDVNLTDLNMSSNSSSHSLNIQNNSGVSVEIDSISLSWKNGDFITEVTLDGTTIFSDTSSSNGGFSVPGAPWTIGALDTFPAKTLLAFKTSKKSKDARAVITFSDYLCSGTTLDSNSP